MIAVNNLRHQQYITRLSILLSVLIVSLLNSSSYFLSLRMIQFEDAYDPKNFDVLLTDIDSTDIHEVIPRIGIGIGQNFCSRLPSFFD